MRGIGCAALVQSICGARALRPTQLALVDANAIGNLFAPSVRCPDESLRDVRSRLRLAAAARKVGIVMTAALMAELIPLSVWDDRHTYTELRDLVDALCAFSHLQPYEARVEAELRLGRRLHDHEAFGYGWAIDSRLPRTIEAARVQNLKEEWREKEERRRREWLAHFGEVVGVAEPRLQAKAATSYARENAPYLQDQTQRFADEIRRTVSRRPPSWVLSASSAPTIWRDAAYAVHRRNRLDAMTFFRAGELEPKVDPGDRFDQCHFIDALYADVLVTDDARFRELVVATGLGPPLLSSAEWFAALLGP